MSAHDTTFYDYSLLSTLFYFHHKKYTIWLMINMNQYDMNYGIPNARRSLIHKQYWCTHSRCEAQAFDWLSPMNRWHMFCSLPTFWFLFLAFVVVVANMGIWHGTVADTTFICFNEWKIADVVCELRNILANFFFFPFCFHLFLIGIRLVIIILSAAARQRLAISLRRVNTLCVKREFICFLMKK